MMRRRILILAALIILALTAGHSLLAQSSPLDLQAAIDAAQPGAVIRVPPGVYRGNFVIEKPVTLEGIDWPVLDGNNQGNVITINEAPDVTLRGFIIRNSGARLDKENAGVAVDKSPRLVVENNRLENVLFGIYIRSSDDSRIAHNIVGAKDIPVAARGDAIRVWYSHNTEVIGNRVDKGRDVVMWFNNGSIIRDNIITNGRYGLHFMYCDDNLVEDNWIEGNSVGAFLMYSRRLTLRHNVFINNRGPSGYGIGLKDMDGVEATDNLFQGNRVGMYFDNSPWSLDVSQHFTRNAFVHNDIGLLFNPSVKRNAFSHNSFIDNLEQVGLTGGGTFEQNEFTVGGEGNFWSDYAGYDANGDGLGDLPYVSKSLFENMMDKNPALRLFQLSPAQQAIELAARAFPIFQPQPKLTDDAPLMTPVIPAVHLPPPDSPLPVYLASIAMLVLAGLTVIQGVRFKIQSPKLQVQSLGGAPETLSTTGKTPMISISNLTKTFGDFTAVNNLSFEVSPGEAVALWGENGAGKTTVIRCILGLYTATGEIRVCGHDVKKAGKQARANIGYVPQELSFYEDLSARQSLRFYARLKHAPASRVETVLSDVGLSEHGDKPVAALSGGMKQRLALAIALLSDPPLLLLDEPTSNLDTAARESFIHLLLHLKEGGKTLLFTSHRLEDVETLASRVLVLERGNLKLVCHEPAELASRLGMQLSLRLYVPEGMRHNALKLLQDRGFIATLNGRGVRVAVSPTAKTAPLQVLLAEAIEVNNFEIENGQ